MTRTRLLVAVAVVAAWVGLAVAVLPALLGPDRVAPQSAPASPSRSSSLERCAALWNRPANAPQQAVLTRAALSGPGVSVKTPAGKPVSTHVLVLRYRGPPLEDVGVGRAGVNARGGECLLAHPSNVLFLYTSDGWQQVGYSPGLAFTGIPQRATKSPNAVVNARQPGQQPGAISLTR